MPRFSLTTIVLVLTIVASVSFLFVTAPTPASVVAIEKGVPVTVASLVQQSVPRMIEAYGTIELARSVQLAPEVSGRVTYVHPQLEEGAVFAAGTVLFSVDETTYRSAVTRAENAVVIARADVQLEEGQQQIARRELQQLEQMQTLSKSDRQLVLRVPQLDRAKARLAQATADLHMAKEDLARTAVRVPFTGYVSEKTVTKGQLLAAGTVAVTLIDSGTLYLRLALQEQDIQQVQAGMPVEVITSGNDILATGSIISLLPVLSTRVHSPQVLVSIPVEKTALDISVKSGKGLIRVGDFVRARISAGKLHNIYAVPSATLSLDGHLMLATTGDRLKLLPVTTVWQDTTHSYVKGDIQPGDRLVTSPLGQAKEGAPLIILEHTQ